MTEEKLEELERMAIVKAYVHGTSVARKCGVNANHVFSGSAFTGTDG